MKTKSQVILILSIVLCAWILVPIVAVFADKYLPSMINVAVSFIAVSLGWSYAHNQILKLDKRALTILLIFWATVAFIIVPVIICVENRTVSVICSVALSLIVSVAIVTYIIKQIRQENSKNQQERI